MPLANSGGENFGPISLTDALTNSVNTVFAQVGEQVGREHARRVHEAATASTRTRSSTTRTTR